MLWLCLILFSAAFTTTVLATPHIITLARFLGAMDAPDGFRKQHHGATPRMGGLAVGLGLVAALLTWFAVAPAPWYDLIAELPTHGLATVAAFAVVVAMGILDDQRGLSPSIKLMLQAAAACLLFIDGCRIEKIFLFGVTVDFGWLALPATCFWFLGCMNVWNLIDGMDGLASGVGVIVSATLLIAARALGHLEVAYAAAGMAGALAGFLMFNFHPAKVFLGDTGSLLLGTVLGMLAIHGSLKSGMTVAILVPVLAMGLPIVDTFLAIVRRWIRHLPWNVADHGHLHHRLMAFGLTQRQASFFLYSFTVLLCASALASLALQSDSLALLLALVGTLALTTVFAARREESARFFEDLKQRLRHRRLEQQASRIVWEAIQRVANAPALERLIGIVDDMGRKLDCSEVAVYSRRRHQVFMDWARAAPAPGLGAGTNGQSTQLELRLVTEESAECQLELTFCQHADGAVPLSLGVRFLTRFHRELLQRIEQLTAEDAAGEAARAADAGRTAPMAPSQSKPTAWTTRLLPKWKLASPSS